MMNGHSSAPLPHLHRRALAVRLAAALDLFAHAYRRQHNAALSRLQAGPNLGHTMRVTRDKVLCADLPNFGSGTLQAAATVCHEQTGSL